jgi:DNA-binding CsgD family transcriptional regulator
MYKIPEAITENGFTLPKLSQREIEIILLLREGYTQNEVAAKLGIKRNTVKNHVQNANSKTNTTGTPDIINFYNDFILSLVTERAFTELCKEEDQKIVL